MCNRMIPGMAWVKSLLGVCKRYRYQSVGSETCMLIFSFRFEAQTRQQLLVPPASVDRKDMKYHFLDAHSQTIWLA